MSEAWRRILNIIIICVFLETFVVCQDGQNCTVSERVPLKTCVNCKASEASPCVPGTPCLGAPIPNCRQACLATPPNFCLMGERSDATGDCCIYITCTDVSYSTGYTTLRRSCTTDCLEVELARHDMMTGTCNTISYTGVTLDTEDKCLSYCFDTTGCRGVTWEGNSTTCTLHDCDTMAAGNSIFFSFTCAVATTTTTTTEPTTPTSTMRTTTMTTTMRTTTMTTTMEATTTMTSTEMTPEPQPAPPSTTTTEVTNTTTEVTTTETTEVTTTTPALSTQSTTTITTPALTFPTTILTTKRPPRPKKKRKKAHASYSTKDKSCNVFRPMIKALAYAYSILYTAKTFAFG